MVVKIIQMSIEDSGSASQPPGRGELDGVYRRPGMPDACLGLGEAACVFEGCPGRQLERIGEGSPPSTRILRSGEGYCPTYQGMTPGGLVYNLAQRVNWDDHPVAMSRPAPPRVSYGRHIVTIKLNDKYKDAF